MLRCGWTFFTGTTCIFVSRSGAILLGAQRTPSAQIATAIARSPDLVVRLIGEVNLTRAVKLVPCLPSLRASPPGSPIPATARAESRFGGEPPQILEGIEPGIM